MNSDLLERLETRAHFVTGAEPWERNDHDPHVAASVKNAKIFLETVGSNLDEPNITGGTTSNPDTILTVYWIVRGINNIFGVYVSFKSNDTCKLNVSGPGKSSFEIDNLSVNQLMQYDIAHEFREIEYKAKNQARAGSPKPDFS